MKRLRKTKIICTIGPSTNNANMIEQLIDAGMNCARLNCSHGTIPERQKIVDILDKTRKDVDYPLALLLDTKGPEFRVKTFKNGSVCINKGDEFILTTDDVEGHEGRVSVSYKNLCKELKVGDRVLVNDGLVVLEVKSITEPDIVCDVVIGGVVSNNKSLNFPGLDLDLEYLSENDKQDLLFAIKNDFDYIACSFVSNADDIKSVRDFLDDNGGEDIYLIAKIENQSGIDNIEEICEYCNGIMVARGDLGVEISFEKIPYAQKQIIKTCEKLGKLVITSTEMLESMIENPRPTRAEVSDVANAVYDGTAAVMLSGETAAGKYPIEAVKTMSKIVWSTEGNINYEELLYSRKPVDPTRSTDAIAHATCTMAVELIAKCIVNSTTSGFTSEMISHFRPSVDVLTLTPSMREVYKLALFWGINPKYFKMADLDVEPKDVIDALKDYYSKVLDFETGDKFLVNAGINTEELGYSNSIFVETI